VKVVAGQVTPNINAVLELTHTVKSIATSSGLSNTILLSLEYIDSPIYTTDGGTSWHAVPTTPWVDHGTPDSPLVGLTVRDDPASPMRILAAASSLYGGYENGLWRSGDEGETWARQKFPYGSCEIFEQTFRALVVSPVDPKRILLLNHCYRNTIEYRDSWRRLFISRDAALTWQERPEQQGSFEAGTDQVVPSPVLAERIYTYGEYPHYTDGWLMSDNWGENWQSIDLPVEQLVLDSQDAERMYGISIYEPSEPGSRLGIRTENGGENWEEWDQQPCPFGASPTTDRGNLQLMAHPTQSKVLFVRCDQGLYRSDNGGDSWTQLESFPGQLLAPDYGHAGRILWGTNEGLWASTDNGDNWQNIMPNYELIAPAQQEWNYLPDISANE
jgi:hypothetical protein